MNDTSPEIQRKYYKMIMDLPPEERLMMSVDMFESVKTMILSSLDKDLSEKEIKKQLFLRLYGNDFNEEEKKAIIQSITATQ